MDTLYYLSIGLNVFLVLIVIGLLYFKSLREAIRKLIVEAEKLIPGATGVEKRNWVIEQIRNNKFLARILSDNSIVSIIENVIKLLNDFSKPK